MRAGRFAAVLGVLWTVVAAGAERQVVIYTALDRMFSEPILADFQARTGVAVKPVYDTESTKTVGLYNRIVAERGRPVCDVFWNNEIARTLALDRQGLLAAYDAPSASDIPAAFRSSRHTWTGFAARARVIIYNTRLIKAEDAPDSIFDLLDPRWKGKAALALPLFGSTSTHAAALFAYLSPGPAKAFFEGLVANDVKILAGNATVRDDVAAGIVAWGLTDTDDAYGAIAKGKPVEMVYPDQQGIGTLVFPNTLALILGAPHPDEGRALIDYLLSADVERRLAEGPGAQMPVRPSVPTPGHVKRASDLRCFILPWDELPDALEVSQPFLQSTFMR